MNKIEEIKNIWVKKLTPENNLVRVFTIPKSNDYIIHSELKIIRIDSNGNEIWSHDYHHDIIIVVKLEKNKIYTGEWNKNTYYLDLETGKLLKLKE